MNSKTISSTTPIVHSCLVAVIACLIGWFFYNSSSDNIHEDESGNNTLPNTHKKDVLHAISGAIGSALSISLLYPLETVRTRLQVDTSLTTTTTTSRYYSPSSFLLVYTIGKKEGFRRGLYRGWFSLVVALMILNFVYFYCFHALRRWWLVMMTTTTTTTGLVDWMRNVITSQGGSNINEIVIDLVAGYSAGCVAVLVTGPLWLVNTRLKLQGVNIGQVVGNGKSPMSTNKQYTGILNCLYRISKEEGILTLWHGTFTSIILSLNPAIQLGVYEMLKRHHLIIGGGTGAAGSLEPFVNALIAKFISTVITYPIQVLQTRHRAGLKKEEAVVSSQKKRSCCSIFLGLYRGLESKLLQTCLNSALMFVAYERLVSILTTLLLLDE
ncbi:hypothetical protein ACHAXR_006613 [Thalassiosira sp. AJA248-18]